MGQRIYPTVCGYDEANLGLYFSCAADVLSHTLRTVVLPQTELSNAQPNTVRLRLFKLAVSVVEYKDRIKRQRSSQWPVKSWPHRVTEILSQVPPPSLRKTAGAVSVPNRFDLSSKGR